MKVSYTPSGLLNKPSMRLMPPNRNINQSMPVVYRDLELSARFNNVSEIKFKVDKKFFDNDTGEYVKNPIYNKLQKKMVLKCNCLDSYMSIPKRTIGDSSFYTYNAITHICSNFSVADEKQILDIGTESGYYFDYQCMPLLASGVGSTLVGNSIYIPNGTYLTKSYASAYISGADRVSSCSSFIPVNVGDVIAIPPNNETYKYSISYYSDNTDQSFVKSQDGASFIECSETDYTYIQVTSSALGNNDSGYVRFTLYNMLATALLSPTKDTFVIYSRERFLTSVSNRGTTGKLELNLNWWTIVDVEEGNDGVYQYKEVTAYSFEYTLQDKDFTLSASTLNLYTPPAIKDIVEGNTWVSSKFNTSNQKLHCEGLLNQLLKYMPNWSIGYIESSLMSRYRTFTDDVSNNIYTFLTEDVQKTFKCFIIFDTDNLTINVYEKNTLLDNCKCDTFKLEWGTVLKETKINTTDDCVVTALNVYSSDDSDYSLSLVNPLGNRTLYNFTNYNNMLNYKVGESTKTLLAKVTDMQTRINENMATYRGYGKTLIDLTKKLTKAESDLEIALGEYQSKAETINVYLTSDFASMPLGYEVNTQYPRTPIEMSSGAYAPLSNFVNYHNSTLYYELFSLSKTYWDLYNSTNNYRTWYNSYYNAMKALQNVCKPENIFTADELKELDYYITQGTWRDENCVFSETYDTDDIYETLISLYNDAVEEHKLRCKPSYEFTINTSNFIALQEYQYNLKNLFLGSYIWAEIKDDDWQQPILLELNLKYDTPDNLDLTFTNNYNIKPLNFRYGDLFDSIQRVSAVDKSYTAE